MVHKSCTNMFIKVGFKKNIYGACVDYNECAQQGTLDYCGWVVINIYPRLRLQFYTLQCKPTWAYALIQTCLGIGKSWSCLKIYK